MIEEGKDSCMIDLEPISDNHKNTCYGAGGKFYVVDLLWNCTSINGVSQNFTYMNFPNCHGLNCTADELESLSKTFIPYEMAEQGLLAQGFTCNVSDINEAIVEKSDDGTLHWSHYGGILSVSIFIVGVFIVVVVCMLPCIQRLLDEIFYLTHT